MKNKITKKQKDMAIPKAGKATKKGLSQAEIDKWSDRVGMHQNAAYDHIEKVSGK